MKKKSNNKVLLIPIISIITIILLYLLLPKVYLRILGDPRCRTGNSEYETGCVSDQFIEDSVINNPVECLSISPNDCIGPKISIYNNCGIPFTIEGIEYEELGISLELDEGPYEFNGEINGEIFTVKGLVVSPCY